MRRPSLTMRFFLVLATLALALVVLMSVAIRWSVRHDIVDYLKQREFARLQPLQALLQQQYGETGSWQFLQQPGQLEQLIERSGVNDRRHDRRLPPPHHNNPGRPPPSERHPPPESRRMAERRLLLDRLPEPPPLMERLQVLDAAEQHVAGQRPPEALASMRQPLHWQGQIIGFLQLQLPPFVQDGLEQRFLTGQLNTLMLIAGGALVLALMVAWWLGRGLVKPILSVATTVRQLADGQLDSRTVIQRSDELGHLARDVDRLAATLTANERLRRELMADVSHEFRTPLALLQGKIEAMQDGVLPSDARTLATLHDATRRLSRLVDDLHQVALADAGALKLQLQSVHLRDLIDQAAADASAKFASAGLKLHVIADTDLVCEADRQRLRQVLDNLLHNSLRYTDAGGEVHLQLQSDGAWAKLSVEDSAPGVTAAQRDKLFDRFFRAESSRSREAGGSGLGLSVVKAIVQAHAGTVTAQDSRLGGLAIVIRLPLAKGQPE